MNIAIFYALIAMLGYSITDVLVKKAVDKDDFFSCGMVRTFVTSLFLFLVILFSGQGILPQPSAWFYLLLVGLLGGVAYFFYLQALQASYVSIMSTIAHSFSAITVLMGVFILGESLGILQIFGVVLVIGGTMLLSLNPREFLNMKHLSSIKGLKYVLLALPLWAVMAFYLKYAVARTGALQTAFYFEFLVFVFLLPFVLFHSFRMPSKAGIAYAATAGSFNAIASGVWMLALATSFVALVTPIIAATPLFVTIIAWLWLKEKLTTYQLVNIAVIVFGLILLSFS